MDSAVDLLAIGACMFGLIAAVRAVSPGIHGGRGGKGRGGRWIRAHAGSMAEINSHGDEDLRNAVVDDFAAGSGT